MQDSQIHLLQLIIRHSPMLPPQLRYGFGLFSAVAAKVGLSVIAASCGTFLNKQVE
jgi:hypothetical protein